SEKLPRSCAAGTGWRDSLKGASRPGSHSSAAASQLLVPQHSWPHWLLNPSLSNRSANSQQGKVCSEGRYTAFRRPISSLFTYTDGLLQGYSDSVRLEIDPPHLPSRD